jgi:hypothetical protein
MIRQKQTFKMGKADLRGRDFPQARALNRAGRIRSRCKHIFDLCITHKSMTSSMIFNIVWCSFNMLIIRIVCRLKITTVCTAAPSLWYSVPALATYCGLAVTTFIVAWAVSFN